jgi:hypothetical protein
MSLEKFGSSAGSDLTRSLKTIFGRHKRMYRSYYTVKIALFRISNVCFRYSDIIATEIVILLYNSQPARPLSCCCKGTVDNFLICSTTIGQVCTKEDQEMAVVFASSGPRIATNGSQQDLCTPVHIRAQS